MVWLSAIGLALKPIIIPIFSALVAWFIPSPQEILRRKLIKLHEAEESGTGLDKLP